MQPTFSKPSATAEIPRPGTAKLLGLPWQLLVEPSKVWDTLRSSDYYPAALLTQWLLLASGWLLGARPLAEGLDAAGVSKHFVQPTGAGILGGLILLAFLVPVSALFVAALAHFSLLLTRSGIAFRKVLCFASYAFMPAFLGRALGLLLFAIAQPLSTTADAAITSQLSPGVFGLNSLFAPLSFAWTMASFFDIFGLWSLWLCWLGLRRYLGISAARAGWSLLALMLIWLLVLTLFWQGIVRGLP